MHDMLQERPSAEGGTLAIRNMQPPSYQYMLMVDSACRPQLEHTYHGRLVNIESTYVNLARTRCVTVQPYGS